MLWLTWHKGVAINVWRGVISLTTDVSCQICVQEIPKCVIHRFGDCTQAQVAWNYTDLILQNFATKVNLILPQLDNRHAVFEQHKDIRNIVVARPWALLQGITIWTLWITWNDTMFNHNITWTEQKIRAIIWSLLVEYGRAAWLKSLQQCQRSIGVQFYILATFDASWSRFENLWKRDGIVGSSTILIHYSFIHLLACRIYMLNSQNVND